MGKQPAFQFYIGDWLKDTRGLSLEAKGAWIDLLAFMWHTEKRGTLSMKWENYSRHLGTDIEQTKRVISELIDLNVCDCCLNSDGQKITDSKHVTNCNKNVTLINRRMVREDNEKENNRLRVARHREKNKCNVNVMSLSSSSSSLKEIYKEKILCNGCKHAFVIEKNFFKCGHPFIEKLGKKKAIKRLKILSKEFQREEWFNWPEKFNINWLINCDGH